MRLTRETNHDNCDECDEALEPGVPRYYEGPCEHKRGTKKHVLHTSDCCEKSRELLTPYVYFPYYDEYYRKKPKPIWVAGNIKGPEDYREYRLKLGKDYYETKEYTTGGIHFCPFCGTKLPGIVKEDSPPSPIMDIDDCGRCACGWPRSEGQCECWPREFLVKIDTGGAE